MKKVTVEGVLIENCVDCGGSAVVALNFSHDLTGLASLLDVGTGAWNSGPRVRVTVELLSEYEVKKQVEPAPVVEET